MCLECIKKIKIGKRSSITGKVLASIYLMFLILVIYTIRSCSMGIMCVYILPFFMIPWIFVIDLLFYSNSTTNFFFSGNDILVALVFYLSPILNIIILWYLGYFIEKIFKMCLKKK